MKPRLTDANRCESTIEVDDLLETYRKEREELFRIFSTSPHDIDRHIIVEIDRDCQNHLGSMKWNSSYSCPFCVEMGRLCDLKSQLYNPFMIEWGKSAGKQLVLHSKEKDITISSEWDIHVLKRIRTIKKNNPNLVRCSTHFHEGDDFFTSDDFTNSFIVSSVITRLVFPVEHVAEILKAAVCRNRGYQLSYYNLPIRKFFTDKLDRETVIGLFIQIASFFKMLSKYEFVHGSATVHSLMASPQPVGYLYESVTVNSEFTLKFSNFEKSSIRLSGSTKSVRIIPRSDVDISLVVSDFRPSIETKRCLPEKGDICFDSESSVWYRVGEDTKNLYSMLRYSGVSLFGSSFDIYTLITSLMTWEPFYRIVKSDPMLNGWWMTMWEPYTGESVERKIITITNNFSVIPRHVMDVASVFTGMWLRCTILDHIWSLIKDHQQDKQ